MVQGSEEALRLPAPVPSWDPGVHWRDGVDAASLRNECSKLQINAYYMLSDAHS